MGDQQDRWRRSAWPALLAVVFWPVVLAALAWRSGRGTRTKLLTIGAGVGGAVLVVAVVLAAQPPPAESAGDGARQVAGPAATPTPAADPAPPPALSPAAAAVAPPDESAGCDPLDEHGACYRPGDLCRRQDRGRTGRAADGEPIVCERNHGWRWQPA